MDTHKHTQGPWKIDPCLDIIGNTKEGNGVVCAITHEGVEDFEEVNANARLIAAAPDLLEALDLVNRAMNAGKVNDTSLIVVGTGEIYTVHEKVRAAISKATGEQPQ